MPSVVVVVGLLAVAVGSTVRGQAEPVEELSGPPLSEVLTFAENPDLPVTYEDARAAGALDQYDWGPRCDPTRAYNDTDTTLARLAIPSVYAPPCVPVWDGNRPWVSAGGDVFTDNGGATGPGVTAGPHLSAETFAGGLFNYPPTGGTDVTGREATELYLDGYLGGDTTPAISFGPRGEGEAVDYVAVDDFTTAWWSPDTIGPDESGQEGRGMWHFTGMGLRLPLAEPTYPESVTEDFLFETRLSDVGGELWEAAQAFGLADIPIADDILEQTPPLDALPTYPTWPESPAVDRGGQTLS